MSREILIFSHSGSPRLQYVVDFISGYYNIPFRIVYDENKYANTPGDCKINYGYHRILPGEIFIHSHVLLFETSVHPVKIECFETGNYKAFFRTQGDLDFDIFAAIFYLLSRYEEYLPHKKDSYGRYAHENSVAFREGFLHLPMVNIWLEDFRKKLVAKNVECSIPLTGFSFLPTYDIDMAWSYRNKGFRRNTGAMAKHLMKLQFGKIVQRVKVLRRKKPDPYDAYEWMYEVHEKFRLLPFYFFLVAKDKSRYDKNIDTGNKEFIDLVKNIASKYRVGLHPSWKSGDVPGLIAKEKNILEQVTGSSIHASRQHFIRFDLPGTYRHLINIGILNDYSMGYGSINGFRASVAAPFFWYDLRQEQSTGLLLHPFCFMDANSYYEQSHDPEEALNEILQFYNVVRSVNGTMITIWHNSFLGTDENFKGWREVYEEFLATVSSTVST